VGGRAALFVEIGRDEDFSLLARAVEASGAPVLVLGKGSNLLVADSGFPGIAVTLGDHFGTVVADGERLRAGGGAALPVAARRSAAAGLTGFEWAVGVPGSVGGAVRMNAGGHGAEIKDSLVEARVVDLAQEGTESVRKNNELALAYRSSAISSTEVVVEATFQLVAGDVAESEARISEIVQWRRENQPGGQNAGSVFTNPDGDSAGRLVDAAGLKGFRVGSACVSEKHANFFQADAGGSADDVVALIREVQQRVREAMGVELTPEVKLVGFPPIT
jgi:UDP-N-acetylmuramate dehydrogenase